MMYTVDELRREIERRRNDSERLRGAVVDFCYREYGLRRFTSRVAAIMGENEVFQVCLARQIPTANIEHLAARALAGWLEDVMGMPVQAVALGLRRDVFTLRNPYKRSLVCIPRLGRGRRGPAVRTDSVFPWLERLEGIILGRIVTQGGQTLPAYHQAMRDRAFGDANAPVDLSEFHRDNLQHCAERGKRDLLPKRIFVRKNEHEEERPVHSGRMPAAFPGNVRPPAEWYYLFYLMLFLDGRRALLSTVGDDEEVAGWFRDSIDIIETATGERPLIISTPAEASTEWIRSGLLECPDPELLDGWEERLRPPMGRSSLTIYQAVLEFERGVLNLAKG